ncbi:hypothetical protein AHQ81_003238 [Salmonella enterica subsp. enterica]|nr:hypothetical protein [Salmonella enterica subsp. enterica]
MSDITANVVVSMPSQLFTMARSFKAVAKGKIYIGKIDTDPVNPENQIPVYLEREDGTHIQVPQPIVINAAGYPVYNGQIAKFVTVQGHSMAVYDAYGTQQFYYPNVLKYDPDQLQVKLADPSDGFGDSLVAVKQPGDGTVARTVHDKMAENYTFEDFGAKGDWVTDDTASLNAAALFSQTTGNTIYGSAQKGYKFTSGIQLVNQTTNVSAKFEGAGRERCFLVPVGSMDAAIKIWGTGWGASGQGAVFGAVFKGFEIRANGLTGNALDIRRAGLWCDFSDLRITDPNGIGLYHEAVFDHSYRDIEVRSATGLGIKTYEPKPTDTQGFQENSFLEFHNVNVLSSNGKTTQWEIDGGGAFSFYKCKPSEGTIGIDIKGIAKGFTFYQTYCDGQTDNATIENIGIRVASGCHEINVYGGRFWNTKYAIDQGAGGCSIKGVNIAYDSPTGATVYHLLARNSIDRPLDFDPYMSILNEGGVPNFYTYRAVDANQHSYTPTLSNVNIGSGFTFGAYNKFGNKTRVFVHTELGAGSSITGAIAITAPHISSVTSFVSGTLFDASDNKSYPIQGYIKSGEQGMTLTYSGGLVNDINPFALSSGDMIHIDGEYWS